MCAAAADATDATAAPRELTLASPSKVNLFLRVLSRRGDGYHELASLFQAISLRDELHMAVLPGAADDELECDAAGVPTDGSNLVVRALDAYRRATGSCARFRVRLDKCVPAQAGLGGGSGNAATALWGANVLDGGGLGAARLAEVGGEVGSDVGFFFSMGTAYCTGRGEVVRDVGRLAPQTLWVVKPEEGLSTPEVFGALDLEAVSEEEPEELLRRLKEEMLVEADAFVNDLERPSFALAPRLREVKDALLGAGFSQVCMSGSGTAFFCLGEPDKEYYGDMFGAAFAAEWNVRVFRAFFLWRRHPDYWYLQQPSDDELLEWQQRRDSGDTEAREEEPSDLL